MPHPGDPVRPDMPGHAEFGADVGDGFLQGVAAPDSLRNFENLLANLVSIAQEMQIRYEVDIKGVGHVQRSSWAAKVEKGNTRCTGSVYSLMGPGPDEPRYSTRMENDAMSYTISRPSTVSYRHSDASNVRFTSSMGMKNDVRMDRGSSSTTGVSVSGSSALYQRSAEFDQLAQAANERHDTAGHRADNVFKAGARQQSRPGLQLAAARAASEMVGTSRMKFKREAPISWAPDSNFVLGWNSIACLFLFFDLMVLPAEVFRPGYGRVNQFFTWMTLVFWCTQIPMSILTGYIDKEGNTILKKRKTAKRYLLRWCLLDITLVTCDILHAVQLVPVFRYLRCVRILFATRVLSPVLQRVQSNVVVTAWSITRTFLMLAYSLHIMACLYWVIGYDMTNEGWTRHEFGGMPGLSDQPPRMRYARAMQYAFTFVGFGIIDVFPTNAEEAIYGSVATMTGIVLCFTTLAYMVTVFSRLEMLTKKRREKEEALRSYLLWHGVSQGLRNKIWEILHTYHKKASHYLLEDKVELCKILPKKVQLELRSEVYLPVLKVYPFFHVYSLSDADHRAMSKLIEKNGLRESTFQEHEELFSEGGKATSMYFLVEGKLVYKYRNLDGPEAVEDGCTTRPMETLDSGQSFQFDGPATPRRLHESVMAPNDSGVERTFLNEAEDVGHLIVRIGPIDWLCEAALWMNWDHQGVCTAKSHAGIVAIDTKLFQLVFASSLPQASDYATRFVQFANRCQHRLTDYLNEVSAVNEIAEDIFRMTVTTFDVRRCHPFVGNLYKKGEWDPHSLESWNRTWSSAWQEQHQENQAALITSMCKDMKYNVVLTHQTLFAQNIHRHQLPTLSYEDQQKHDQTVIMLKNLFLAFAVCGLESSAEDNGGSTKAWPFPVATALGHGSRIMVRLHDIRADEFVNVLCFGKRDAHNWDSGVPGPIYSRVAASHAVKLVRRSEIHEVKAKSGTLFFKHFGVDLPLGGFGNPVPPCEEDLDVGIQEDEQMLIGPAGVPYKQDTDGIHFVNKIQHGHLYMLMHDFKSDRSTATGLDHAQHTGLSALLIGIEGSAPMKQNFFGMKHTVEATSNRLSAFGKRKWRDYRATGQGVPAEMGGVLMDVTTDKLSQCEFVIEKMACTKPSDEVNLEEVKFFQHLLQGSDADVADLMIERFGDVRDRPDRPAQMGRTSTHPTNMVVRDSRNKLNPLSD
jgi:CRP-like cAMP-binding protein